MERLTKLRDGLKPQTGVIHLPTAKASLNLGKGYYFLSAEDAKKVLVDAAPQTASVAKAEIFVQG